MKIKYLRYSKDFTKSFIRPEEVNYHRAIMGVFVGLDSLAFELMLIKKLLGQTVKAFGPKSKGYWGRSEKIHTYKINDIVIEPEKDYDNYRIYLENYDADSDPLIYTDETFENNIIKLLKGLGETEYTEQGMQGRNYVSMTITYHRV